MEKYFLKKILLRILFVLTILFLNISFIFSQNGINKIDSIYRKNGMEKIADHLQKNGWLTYKKDLKFYKETFFQNYHNEFGLGPDDQMTLHKENFDEYGYEHYRYYQKYKGIKVEFGEIIVHTKDGVIEKSNGKLTFGLNVNVKPVITSEQAIERALDHVHAQKYAWEEKIGNKELAEYPKTELVILPRNEKLGIDKDYLAYKLDVYSLQPLYRAIIYIDANTGKVIFENNRIRDIDIQGSALTLYNGTVTITTDYFNGFYRLRESGRGGGIETFNMENRTNSFVDFTDADNYWSPANAGYDVHWATEKTYDYYLQKFNRNSYNGAGAVLSSYVHYGTNYNNSYWDGDGMTYGDGDGIHLNPIVCLDLVGHEITHGVTDYSANLIYRGETGALNESFSDIFGTCIEFYAKSSTANWLVLDQVALDDRLSRSLNNPKSKGRHKGNGCDPYDSVSMPRGQPNTYFGTYWFNTSDNCDFGGVHTNSGVQNFWFYLLTNGGSGTNDNGTAYNVSGININKAAAIAYRNLTVYLTSTSDYADARQGSIEAATDLFGFCSNEVVQVISAWNAVGIYAPTGSSGYITYGTNITNLCNQLPDGAYYLANNSIQVPYGECSSTYLNSSDIVVFRAANFIKLNPGFKVNSGSHFKASIMTCGGDVVLKSNGVDKNNENIDINKNAAEKFKINTLNPSISVHPNPATDRLFVEGVSDFNADIYDLIGRKVMQLTKTNGSIEMSGLNPGIYMLHLKSTGQTYIQKIVKR